MTKITIANIKIRQVMLNIQAVVNLPTISTP